MKKVVSILLSFIIVLAAVLGIMPTEKVNAAVSYNANAALDYARVHWNDGQGLCAEFVSRCVQAGGINMPVITTTYECYKKISELSGVPGQDLTLNSSGYATYAANNSKLAAGDVVVQWCYTCNLRPHILLCGGYNASGNATFYAHNSALNNGVYQLNKNSQHKSTCNIGAKVIHLAVSADTTPPVISDVHVEDVNSEGYTVVCRAEDTGGVVKVQFPTWTHANGQDDLNPDWGNDVKCRGWQNGTTWSFRVNVSDHNNEGEWYCTHIYAWDTAGNFSNAGIDVYVDRTAPVISDIQILEISEDGYTVTCKVEDTGSDVLKVQFPTWTIVNDQDDIAENWGENPLCSGTRNGTVWSYRVKTSDHNNEMGFYRTHIYAWDNAGNLTGTAVPDVYIEEAKKDPIGPEDNFSVGDVHIDTEEGTVHYYCEVSAGSDVSTANVNIATDTGISRNYTRKISNGKVDGYLYWLDFMEGMDAIYTITVSVTDVSGNTASNSSSIDARTDVSLVPTSVILNVGESFQFETLKKGVLRVEKEVWRVTWKENDAGDINISDNGLVTALIPGEYRVECELSYTQNNVKTDDWDENIPFCNPGRFVISWLPAVVTVKLPIPGIKNITSDEKGNINLLIQESAGADSYEIIMQQNINGTDGDTVIRHVKAGETEHLFTGLAYGSMWSCKIRACCIIGEQTYYSDWSMESTVKIPDSVTGDVPSNENFKNPDTQNIGSSSPEKSKAENYIPKKTSIFGKITAKSKGFTVKWKKQKSAMGYQVQYSTDKKFTKKSTQMKTVRKASASKLTVKNLKAKKKYYVRVRTYQITDKKTHYSKWSKIKTVRTKC